jgi:hypothetical protein
MVVRRAAACVLSAVLSMCVTAGLFAQGMQDAGMLTLTVEHSSGSFPVPKSALATAASQLEITITDIVNKDSTPFSVFVYLDEEGNPSTKTKRTVVGNFSVFPPDRPGKYLLNARKALEKAREWEVGQAGGEVRLKLEMKRVHESRPWTDVEVKVATPQWKADGIE